MFYTDISSKEAKVNDARDAEVSKASVRDADTADDDWINEEDAKKSRTLWRTKEMWRDKVRALWTVKETEEANSASAGFEFWTSIIQLTFEIKVDCEALKIKKKSAFNSKMSAKRNDKIQSSSVSEKNSTPAEKSKHWTGKLLKQHHVQMKAIQSSEQSQTQLI